MDQIYYKKLKIQDGEFTGEVSNNEISLEPHGYGRFISHKEPEILEG